MTSLTLRFKSSLVWFVLAVLPCAACSGNLPKYDQLKGFRVLALRASRPSLSAGETTTLDALTFVEGEQHPPLHYSWSWCPVRSSAAVGGGCAVNEADFARLLGIEEGAIDFDLGEQETAQLAYPGDPELFQAACDNSADGSIGGSFVFSCARGFPVSIQAEVTYRNQTIRVQKEVRLLFGDLPANENPELGAVSFVKADSKAELEPWLEDEAASLALGERYEVRVEVDERAAELFVPEATVVDPAPDERPESLYISWFISSGEMDKDRTSFVKDGASLAEFGTNEWRLPKSGDEQRDTARLFMVLRDERGGVDWLSREVEFLR